MAEPYFNSDPLPTAVGDRVTVYHRGLGMSGARITKEEATRCEHGPVQYAQYAEAVAVRLVPKGKRNPRTYVETYGSPSTVILAGWGHPDAESLWDESTRTTSPSGDVTTVRGKYRSQSPQWQANFDTMLAAYLASSGTKVVADYRNHDTKTDSYR